MASPLHDNPRSSKEGKKEEKKPEEKPDEKAAAEKKATDKAKDGDGEKPMAEGEKPEGEAASSPKDMFMDGMKSIQKRHESERRDTHGNHREALRQMAGRHGKEIADHFDLHFGEGGGTAAAAKPDTGEAAPAAEEA